MKGIKKYVLLEKEHIQHVQKEDESDFIFYTDDSFVTNEDNYDMIGYFIRDEIFEDGQYSRVIEKVTRLLFEEVEDHIIENSDEKDNMDEQKMNKYILSLMMSSIKHIDFNESERVDNIGKWLDEL